jgi:hypothetical protein
VPSYDELHSAIIAQIRASFQHSLKKIQHCLDQLSDEQLWWRPREEMNSIANLLLHLSGNLGQWIISGVGAKQDVRNRPAEFADRSRRPKAQITSIFRETLAAVDSTIASLKPDELLAPRRIQGYDQTPLSAMLHAMSHFQGHTQEIIHMTRVQLGVQYRFEFVPSSPDQLSVHGPAL